MVGLTMLTRLIETQILHLLSVQAGWGEGSPRTMASTNTSVWEKAAPPALALKPDNSVSPHMSLVPFKLLPQHWSSE